MRMRAYRDRRIMAKRADRVNLTMPRELINRARAKAIAEGSNLSRVVERFLRAWVAGETEIPAKTEEDKPRE
jgi:post-segregation antitoxin (ccd killing protein)